MHRVELKETTQAISDTHSDVPNAPCGVERRRVVGLELRLPLFLMHRVELKAILAGKGFNFISPFLMHRVELKVLKHHRTFCIYKSFLMHRVELKEEFFEGCLYVPKGS